MSTQNFSTYDQVGKVEDISDIISNISPTKTPFQSMIGTESIHNTLYQWQEDSLIAAGLNAVVEGAVAPVATMNATVMRSNTTQILTKTAQSTGSAEAVKTYGRAGELAYQLGLRSSELKRDLELSLVGTGQTAVTGSTSVARQFAGYQAMVDTSVVYTVNGASGSLASVAGSPTVGALREDILLTVSQALYLAGAEANTIMVTPTDKVVIGGFQTNARTRFVDNGDKKVVNVVDIYESPFGSLKVVMNRFQKSTDALVFDASMWKRQVLRNWFRKTLAVTGDSTDVQILGEFGLRHKNFKASGLITNLNG
jgi:hypothetical protein